MNVKKYRAETLRQALEQIKCELGDEALILNTRQVRTNGFLGLGAKTEIEVSVSADSPARRVSTNQTSTANRQSKVARLDLTDGQAATPASFAQEDGPTIGSNLMNALAARAYQTDSEMFSNASPQNLSRSIKPAQPVELSEIAPRIVHPTKNTVTTPEKPAQNSVAQKDEPTLARNKALTSELDSLRAELREVKFSLSSLAVRNVCSDDDPSLALNKFEEFPELYESPGYDVFHTLTSAGINAKNAQQIVSASLPYLAVQSRSITELTRACLKNALPSMAKFSADPLQSKQAMTLALIGPTGVGKTTTLAKLAARAYLRERRRVELITLDTYRIAAVEQLKTYAEIIGVGCHVVRSVLELNAMVQKFEGEATVLIDTTGRSPHDLADQLELADYLSSNEEILKGLVLPATTHQADASVAARKFSMYGANCLIVTKLDETARPGAVLGWTSEANLPLLYLCAGQRVPEDIEIARPEHLAARMIRAHEMSVARAA
jgi:flagellar biosynthesis protein FlhF